MIVADPDLELRLARDAQDLRAARRLRYRVFVEELGAPAPGADHAGRLEGDRFDPFCAHLLLVDRRADPADGEHVVGLYRLLSAEDAARAGGFSSEAEYDLAPLRASGRRLLELSRSCLAPEHRGGGALFMLWNGLAEYVRRHRFELLFGVASFHGTDVDALSEPLSYLRHYHLAPATLRPRARGARARPLGGLARHELDRRAALRALPPLIRAYLRTGGVVGEGAFVDHDLNTTDVFMLLETDRLNPRQKSLYGSPAGSLSARSEGDG